MSAVEMHWVVCLCGSTRFREEFLRVNREETLAGRIVLSVGCFRGVGFVTSEQKVRLDHLHLRKIEMADDIFVINVGGYVGESTRNEIRHALKKGKPIRWLEEISSENVVQWLDSLDASA